MSMDSQLKSEYERIIKEEKLKYKALKKLFVQEKDKYDAEEERVGKMNSRLLDLEKENEELRFSRDRLTKKVEVLQNRCKEIQESKNEGFSFGLGGWLGGETISKEDLEKKNNLISALEEQLELKNEETTQAHEQNFEIKKKFNKEIDELNEKIHEMEKERQTKEIEFQNLVQNKQQISNELNSLKEEKRQLSHQYKSKLDELKQLKVKFKKQIDQTKELVKKNMNYMNDKITQDPIAVLLETFLADFNFSNELREAENEEEIRSFKDAYKDAEAAILSTCYVPYHLKQYTTEQEDMLNLTNSVRNIEHPLNEIWDELSRALRGKLPTDGSHIEQHEIKKKVVQIKMLSDKVGALKIQSKNFFKIFLDQENPRRWDLAIKNGALMNKELVNLLKVFITFLEDEQLLMVTKGEETGMQEISDINSELCSVLSKINQSLEGLNINHKLSINNIYNTIKGLKKEIDTLQKTLRKKSTLMYTYLYDTNDFQECSVDEEDEFSQSKNVLFKKIASFFMPYKNIINNLHCYLVSVTSNTEMARGQISTCQNSVLSIEAIDHIPQTDTHMNICRVQSEDIKQNHHNDFLTSLNIVCRKSKQKMKAASQSYTVTEVSESARKTVTPGMQLDFTSSGYNEPMEFGQAQRNDSATPYKYDTNIDEKLSNGSGNDPVSMSMIAPDNYNRSGNLLEPDFPSKGANFEPHKEEKKANISSMAAKMKSMQDMLNQKLKKVKKINWDLEDE
ncbi:unnamed protein product [Moneuplotes crassus]|uniref:Uncharacterized protein n=2 Tax=Euplotes crassus TaxID=5936 RepID=A0AAD1Y3W7_EUPCR|nr:unnamed protein product [Moneuplotes crassus]